MEHPLLCDKEQGSFYNQKKTKTTNKGCTEKTVKNRENGFVWQIFLKGALPGVWLFLGVGNDLKSRQDKTTNVAVLRTCSLPANKTNTKKKNHKNTK